MAALTSSGVFQRLLEGALLLLGADPAAYSQSLVDQQLLWDNMDTAATSAAFLAGQLANR